jgi:hypothetical protein
VRTYRRRAARAPLAAAAFAAAAVLTAGLTLAAVAGPAGAAVPIPSVPGAGVPTFIGSAAVANPIASFPRPQNPHLAANDGNNIHNDAYATDSYAGSGPLGHRTKVTSALYGVDECATDEFDRAGNLVGLCVGVEGPALFLMNPRTLNVRARYELPPRHVKAGANPLTDLCGGAYSYLDNLDQVVVDTTDRTIQIVADTGRKLVLRKTYDVTAAVPASDCMLALLPDWSGRIWFVTSHGVVGNVDPATSALHWTTLPGEIIDNSFAVDETGGVFIVSDHAMYRFDAAPGTGAPVVTWRQPYDRGSVQKPGQLAQGSGTTPTLIGSDLVAITDNADPQMHVLVYDRSAASGGAPVCSSAVFTPGQSDTENSLVAVGNSLYVENNYGYKGPQSTLLGATTKPGIARVDVTGAGGGGTCSTVWTNNSVAPTSVAKAALGNGLLYAYTKPANALGIDAWYLTAIDLRSGATVFSQLAGTGPGYNNHYAAIYLADGVAYVPTLTGMVRFSDR